MKLLSIDVDMKCLAFCLFTVNSKDDYMIEMLPLEGDSDALSFLYSTE